MMFRYTPDCFMVCVKLYSAEESCTEHKASVLRAFINFFLFNAHGEDASLRKAQNDSFRRNVQSFFFFTVDAPAGSAELFCVISLLQHKTDYVIQIPRYCVMVSGPH